MRIEIGSVVIDDAHACLALAEGQFTLCLPRDHQAFSRLFQFFREDLRTQSPTAVVEIEAGDPRGLVQVPYWSWIDKQEAVMKLLAEYRDDEPVRFVRPLLSDELSLCRCLFTAEKLEISPRCLPIDAIPSFVRARRRIYMTATLADDSVLVTDFGADPEAVSHPITPRTASDLGERMILVPQAVNPEVTDEQIKRFVSQYRSSLNVVVVVPSNSRADFWKDVASPDFILTADNIQNGVERLKATTGNLAVMVNKYDGVDLPDDACRLLVLDGVPDTRRLIDRYEQSILRDSEREKSRQVQRIEQGMGRAIRSNEDYCVVLLMGQRLISHLFAANSARFFSPATARQLDLSSQVSGQISSLTDMSEPIGDLLSRNPQWVSVARSSLIDVTYSSSVTLDPIVVLQRQAFDFARRGRFDAAERTLREAAEKAPDRTVKGWLLEQVATTVHPQDAARSQQVLLAANDLNSSVTKPLAGISYTRMNTATMDQAREAASYVSEYPDANSLIIAVNGLLADLNFRPDSSEEFERSLKEIGRLLGFKSQRPEKEGAGKLDVLWGLGDTRYLLLPCKNSAVTKTVPKRYTDQVAGELIWFRQEYGNSARATSALVHPSVELDADAVPPPEMRIISERQLGPMRDAVQAFAQAVKDHRNDPEHIRRSLSSNNLLGTQIVDRFTTQPNRSGTRGRQPEF